MLPKEALEEYKELFRKHFGIALSDEEVSLRANSLLNLYRAVYGELATFSLADKSKQQPERPNGH